MRLNLPENANGSMSLTFSEFESTLNVKLALGLRRNHHLVIDPFPILSFLRKVKIFLFCLFILLRFITAVLRFYLATFLYSCFHNFYRNILYSYGQLISFGGFLAWCLTAEIFGPVMPNVVTLNYSEEKKILLFFFCYKTTICSRDIFSFRN